MKNRIISTVLMSTVILSTAAPLTTVNADSTDDQIAQQNSKIASAKTASAKAQAQVDSIQSQITDLQKKQASMTDKVKQLLDEETKTSKQIQKLNNNIQQRHASLVAQARSEQVDGAATNYLNAVLEAQSFSDAIKRVTAMVTIANANKKMLDEQKQDRQAMQEKLKDNQEKYAQATKLQQDLAQQAKDLANQKAKLKVAQLDYQLTMTSAEDKKQNLLEQKAKAEADAKALLAAQKAAAQKIVESTQSSTQQSKKLVPTPTVDPVNPNSGDKGKGPTPPPPPPPPPAPSSNPYPAGQCTAFVWQYFHDMGINIPTYMGNAGDWAVYANSGPAAGTIVVFAPGVNYAGPVGHVAVVTAVNSDGTINIIQGNAPSPTQQHIPVTGGMSFIRP